MKVENKVWVITGGGSGMGRQLTLQLLSKGATVAIADINRKALEETQKLAGKNAQQLSIHELDITQSEKVLAFPDEIISRHGAIDGIINNAGIIQPFTGVNELGYDKIDPVMRINFYGTLYMVKAFLPHLLQRPEAHIVNVSSMGGFIPFPGQTLYSASKAAVKLLTEGLYAKLKDGPVRVTIIHPGAIATNITQNSGVEMRHNPSNESTALKMLSADKAAAIMIKGIEKDKFRVMVGNDARFLDIFYRLSPKRAVDFIVKKMKVF